MNTIRFDVDDAALREAFLRTHLLDALAGLRPEDRPLWGRMTAQQMVEHLVWAFEVSSGRAEVACPVPEEKRARMREFLYHNRPMPHGFMNPALREGLPALRYSGLTEAAASLRAEADRFLEHARAHPDALHTHPVFGPIAAEQWSRAHFKHGGHHLLQFGRIELLPA